MTLQQFQLTRHLVLTPAPSTDELVAHNLAQRTTLELTLVEWRALGRFGAAPTPLESRETEPGSLAQRAIEARILVELPEAVNLEMRTAQLRFELTRLLRLSTRLPKAQFEGYVRSLAAERPSACGLLELAQTFFRAFNRARYPLAVRYYQPWYIGICQRYLIGLFDDLSAFFEQVHRSPQTAYAIDPELCLDGMRRPSCDPILNQLPIMPVSTTARAMHVAAQLSEGARVLILGDDDLVSLALGSARPDLAIDVVEVDERLLAVLREGAARRRLGNVSYYTVDLCEGLPDEMCEAYDAVITDPPYNAAGMTAFIVESRRAMRRETAIPTRLYLSTNPELIFDRQQLFIDLEENRMVVLERHRHFNQYPILPNFLEENVFDFMGRFGYPIKARQQLLACPYYYSDLFDCVFVEEARTQSAWPAAS
ncbi:MAG: bis-aminopropyl spermidine synthase family protein [Myxococcales bacterium]|nr:bis-aminopropyl spermidine synthase family protein [Myxococcales bacterium]